MQELIFRINQLFTGAFSVVLLLFTGVVMTVKTGFIQLKYFKKSLCDTMRQFAPKKSGSSNGISPLRAVSAALSGTIGTGNIIGVAAAVSAGGPGAIFWMWVSALLGMATKYSEITLAVKYRTKLADGEYLGGPMYYIKKAFSGKFACLFAFLCAVASFGIGNMTQSNTAYLALRSLLPWQDKTLKFIMIAIAMVIGVVIFGGIKRITSCTAVLIPIMAVFYMGACVLIVLLNLSQAREAICLIIESAFSIRPAVGGTVGYTVATAVKTGFTRGVFTNEAGLGSAPIVHAAADTPFPAKQGLFGIFEVFFDTIVMCTLTGLVIIMSGQYNNSGTDISKITLSAFEGYIGSFASVVIAISTLLFAVATIVSWSYYGESCIKYLSGSKKLLTVYKLIYIAAIYFGAVWPIDFVWGMSDLLNFFMMFFNVLSLIILSNEVKSETKRLKS